jgi:hypothetical protein
MGDLAAGNDDSPEACHPGLNLLDYELGRTDFPGESPLGFIGFVQAKTYLGCAHAQKCHRADEMVYLIADADSGDFTRHHPVDREPAGTMRDTPEHLAMG